MNEERNTEERVQRDSEFDRTRGEVQKRGTRVLAIPPSGPPVPVGIAPPDPRNVVSNFDTRPIGAYDFAHSEHATMGNDEVQAFATVEFSVPDGYTAVLRRVRIEWSPPASMMITQPANGSSPTSFMTISLLRNGGVIPNNSIDFLSDLDEYEWPTHQVFGFWETMGLRLVPTGAFAVPALDADAVFVNVTFMGTLIPTKSRPPEVEIASDPVVVRDYDTLISEPPKTGIAGR